MDWPELHVALLQMERGSKRDLSADEMAVVEALGRQNVAYALKDTGIELYEHIDDGSMRAVRDLPNT